LKKNPISWQDLALLHDMHLESRKRFIKSFIADINRRTKTTNNFNYQNSEKMLNR